MSEYLAGINKFTVTSHSTIETMLDDGQKIMLDHDNKSSVSRPHNYYASVDAPDNLSDALNMAVNQFDLIASGAGQL